MVPPPSSSVISLDWSHLTTFCLLSYVPFQTIVHAYDKAVPGTILDEGAFVSLMPSTTWQALGSPQLVPVTQNLLVFDRGTSQPLGILLKLLATLGGKTIYIDVMAVQGALDFSLLLGRDYVYAMGTLVSSLLCVVCFPRDGRMVTIYQLSFFSPPVPPAQLSSPLGSCSQAVPCLPQVNYVAICSVSASTNDHADGLVHHVLGALELDLSLAPHDMYSSQSVFLPSCEYLLRAMFSYGP